MNGEEENRRSFRVNESVYLKYEVISDEEFHEGLDHRKIRLGISDGAQAAMLDLDARLSDTMFRLNGDSEALGKCITLLNDKINAVANQLPAFKESRAALAKLPPQVCDVGADGMVFALEQSLEPGTRVFLRFLLTSDSRYVETFCTVLRNVDVPPGNDVSQLPHAVAVEFHQMSPAQKEILIQHMFNRESETLRMRRLQIERAR